MSLAELAGADVTRGAIHQIETGRSRPTMRTLQLIASRTGKPISFFVSGEGKSAPRKRGHYAQRDAAIDELERLNLTEDFAAAAVAAESLVKTAGDPWTEAHARFHLGQARTRLTAARGGLEELRKAEDLFRSLRDNWMVVECLDWQVAALGILEDPQASEVGEAALKLCRSLEPRSTQTEARLLSRLATQHVGRHEWRKAVELYGESLEASKSIHDLVHMARTYEGLSIAYQRLGNFRNASASTQRALALHAAHQDRLSIARVKNHLGMLLLRQGDIEGATKQLESSLALCEELGLQRGKSHAFLSLAEVNIARGSLDEAAKLIDDAVELAGGLGELMTQAAAYQLRGRLAALRGLPDAADEAYRATISILTEQQASQRLLECHAEYAQQLERRGDKDRALEQWKLALSVQQPELINRMNDRDESEPAARTTPA
jgi:tetratricopeptide (TPR) repeat protein